MEFHPLAEIFPVLPERDIEELAIDIRENGLLAPITLLEGKILDGRNRFLACKKAGAEIKTRDFPANKDPVSYVVSANLKRRHLSESQRAMVAAKLVDAKGGRPKTLPIGRVSSEVSKSKRDTNVVSETKAAKLLKVGTRSVSRARKILAHGTSEDVKNIESGKTRVGPVAERLNGKKDEPVLDKTGYPVPEKALPYWNRWQEANEILRSISHTRSLLKKIGPDDTMYVEVNVQGVLMRLHQAYTEFSPAVPYAVCSVCAGVVPEECSFCKGRGVISRYRWETCVPEEYKKIRASEEKPN